jgi:hypothetical protein
VTRLMCAIILVGCAAEAPASFGTAPIQVVTSDSGTMRVEVWSAPDPPTHGATKLKLVVHDAATSAPITGLTITVQAWMPAMGHGAPGTPIITDEGDGSYLVDVSLFMAGTWQLRTRIAGPMADTASPEVEVL